MIHFADRINDIREDINKCCDTNLLRKVAALLHAIADVTESQAELVEEQINAKRKTTKNRGS
jgi:hypothetical protein